MIPLYTAAVGALGGALKKKPMEYKPFDQMTDEDMRKEWSAATMARLGEMSTGSKPLMSQADINHQLSGSFGRLDADAAAGRARIADRALGRQGSMGGMAEASFAELDRALLGQKRGLEAGVQNQLAAQLPETQLKASQLGLGFLSNEQKAAMDEYHLQQQAEMARQQFSRAGNIIAGGMQGFGMGMGLGAFGGGEQGGAQNFGGMFGRTADIPGQDPGFMGPPQPGAGTKGRWYLGKNPGRG